MAVVIVLNKRGIAKLQRQVDRVGESVTNAVKRSAQRKVPVDTGELKASIRSTSWPTGLLEHTGRVWVGTNHWAPTEYGSRPHIIRAHGDYSLRNHRTGQSFGPVVHHPGTPEQAFMRPALYQKRKLRGAVGKL